MRVNVEKSIVSGTLACPPSKSYTQRGIFVASLAKGISRIDNALISRDTMAAVSAVENYGAIVSIDGSTITVEGVERLKIQGGNVNCENSGTAIRIATAIYASQCQNWITLTGDSSLRERPMQPLLDAIGSLGVAVQSKNGTPPFSIKGPIHGDSVRIRGNVSSQFISALAIAAPITNSGLKINIIGNMVSRPYLDATIATMEKFSAKVKTIRKYKGYDIPRQEYKPANFSVPQDFSSMALLLLA